MEHGKEFHYSSKNNEGEKKKPCVGSGVDFCFDRLFAYDLIKLLHTAS